MVRFVLSGLAVVAVCLPSLSYAVDRSASQFWTMYRNGRFGFSITYPSGLLAPDPTAGRDAGRMFRSSDGRVTLLAGAGRNDSGDTLDQYRRFLLIENYGNARLDYMPVRRDWFVLSGTQPGTRGDEVFYERVTFACDGRFIHGWRLTYPASERGTYDRIVEGIHRNYRPGHGDGGAC